MHDLALSPGNTIQKEASELVKHEQTDERVPKQGFLLGRAFYVLERGARQEKDIQAQIKIIEQNIYRTYCITCSQVGT